MIVTFVSGYWLMHCHLAHHQSDGMNLVMQEGEIQEMAPLPPNFPTCNNLRVNPNQFLSSLKHQERMLSSKGWYTILLPFPLSLLLYIFFIGKKKRPLKIENISRFGRYIYCNIEVQAHIYSFFSYFLFNFIWCLQKF